MKNKKLVSIVIPVINEGENLKHLIPEIFKQSNVYEIIVIDDGSIDSTDSVLEEMSQKLRVIHVKRYSKHGLGSAVREGIKKAEGAIIGVMDGDRSHHPKFINKLIEPIESDDADICIGSRYLSDGKVEDWPFVRYIVSKTLTLFCKTIINNISDPLSGFIFFRKDLFESLQIETNGYKFGLELIGKVQRRGGIICEIPYVFLNRHVGHSKASIPQFFSLLYTFSLILKDEIKGLFEAFPTKRSPFLFKLLIIIIISIVTYRSTMLNFTLLPSTIERFRWLMNWNYSFPILGMPIEFIIPRIFMDIFGAHLGWSLCHAIFLGLFIGLLIYVTGYFFNLAVALSISCILVSNIHIFYMGSDHAPLEALCAFWGVLGLFFLYKKRYLWAGIMLSLSLLSKLIGIYYIFLAFIYLVFLRWYSVRTFLTVGTPIIFSIGISYFTSNILYTWWFKNGSNYSTYSFLNRMIYLKEMVLAYPMLSFFFFLSLFFFKHRYYKLFLFFFISFFTIRTQTKHLYYYTFSLICPLVLFASISLESILQIIVNCSRSNKTKSTILLCATTIILITSTISNYLYYDLGKGFILLEIDKNDIKLLKRIIKPIDRVRSRNIVLNIEEIVCYEQLFDENQLILNFLDTDYIIAPHYIFSDEKILPLLNKVNYEKIMRTSAYGVVNGYDILRIGRKR